MARKIAAINQQIVDSYVANMAVIGIAIDPTKWSTRNLQRLMIYTVASCISIFEQLLDNYKSSIETTAAKSPAAIAEWLQQKVFEFQYDSANPQIIQFNTETKAPYYPSINSALRIVTRCSVSSDYAHQVKIKVAKGDPPEAMATAEINALQAYISTIGTMGIDYLVTSLSPDLMYISADIYFNAQFSSVISDNVKGAINAFFATKSSQDNFAKEGIINMSDLLIAMRSAQGVNDVVLVHVYARPSTVIFANATKIISQSTELQRYWKPLSGYVIPETSSGNTLDDTLNYIAQ